MDSSDLLLSLGVARNKKKNEVSTNGSDKKVKSNFESPLVRAKKYFVGHNCK